MSRENFRSCELPATYLLALLPLPCVLKWTESEMRNGPYKLQAAPGGAISSATMRIWLVISPPC